MTKNVIDSAILVSVMTGEDSADPVTENSPKDNKKYWEELQTASLKASVLCKQNLSKGFHL
jgi:Asp-tRNA(Asn)/Glu-tRNA(Gln) amidotransferase A subunit family amidase